jgi:hypothetical protein
MKKIGFGLLALAAALAITQSASATPMASGSIAVIGFSDQWTATGVSFPLPNGLVLGTGGTLNGISGLASVGGFNFATSNGVQVFDVNAGQVTFTISGPVTVVADNSTFLNLIGWGWLDETGYAPTWSSFSLTSTQQGQATDFDIAATTPEPSSLLLLGTGLLGLAFIAFRKGKPARTVMNAHQ